MRNEPRTWFGVITEPGHQLTMTVAMGLLIVASTVRPLPRDRLLALRCHGTPCRHVVRPHDESVASCAKQHRSCSSDRVIH